MFKFLPSSGAIAEHQIKKEVSKVSARQILKDLSGDESAKYSDAWARKHVDWREAQKNEKKYRKDYERTMPESLSPQVQNEMWKRAKLLKDQFQIGMLSREELHPVKAFESNGNTVVVVDQERLQANRSVEREAIWLKKNQAIISEFKNIMRHLNPDDPNAGDIEKYRPRQRGIR